MPFLHFIFAFFVAFGLGLAVPATATADDDGALSDARKSAIESLIHDYIMKNPDLILESVRQYQEQQKAAEEEHKREALAKMIPEIKESKTSPVGGNPDGDVTIVEFFDYRCGYCKRVHDTVVEAVESDGNIRMVYKEFPILGPESVLAARAALAGFFVDPDKYVDFHNLLMTSRSDYTEDKIMDFAALAGLDPEAVKKAMNDPRVNQEIQENMAVAQALGINGTPAFIIGDTLVPGAIDASSLSSLVKKARGD